MSPREIFLRSSIKPRLIFVLYDGIENSVFSGQVLKPLYKRLESEGFSSALLISFEKKMYNATEINRLIPNKKKLTVKQLKKYPFVGTMSLYPAVTQLKKILKKEKHYHLIARGPLAGWICIRTINKKNCLSFSIQARGLLAQEYQYSTRGTKNLLKKMIHLWRTRKFETVEKTVYKKNGGWTVEAVSPALKNYMIQTFGTSPDKITIATIDLPEKIKPNLVTQWRKDVRKKLKIKQDCRVFCFNGSAKPWQGPEKVIHFFYDQLKKNRNSFLLVLTQDRKSFEDLLRKSSISQKKYCIISVSHSEIYQYLSACDVGLIFREQHIVNWVSRPTKMLEYQAVGLEVVHNNTISFLKEQSKKLLQTSPQKTIKKRSGIS